MKTLLFVAAGAVVFALFISTTVSAFDLPTVAKSAGTQKCVYVLTPQGKKPCSYLKKGERYDVMWVAG